MKNSPEHHCTAALNVLNTLLLADKHLVRKNRFFLRVKKLEYLKKIMPNNLKLKDLLKGLRMHKFENILLKRKLVIFVPKRALERALQITIMEMEQRYMKMYEMIDSVKKRLEEAKNTNDALNRLLLRS